MFRVRVLGFPPLFFGPTTQLSSWAILRAFSQNTKNQHNQNYRELTLSALNLYPVRSSEAFVACMVHDLPAKLYKARQPLGSHTAQNEGRVAIQMRAEPEFNWVETA